MTGRTCTPDMYRMPRTCTACAPTCHQHAERVAFRQHRVVNQAGACRSPHSPKPLARCELQPVSSSHSLYACMHGAPWHMRRPSVPGPRKTHRWSRTSFNPQPLTAEQQGQWQLQPLLLFGQACMNRKHVKHAGLWEPYQIEGTSEADINRWGGATWRHFQGLLLSADCGAAGVQFMPCHQVYTSAFVAAHGGAVEVPAWSPIVHNYVAHPPGAALALYGAHGDIAQMHEFGTYVVDQPRYLRYLQERLDAAGVQFVGAHVGSFGEVAARGYQCIFNCTGAHLPRAAVGFTVLILCICVCVRRSTHSTTYHGSACRDGVAGDRG